MCTYSAASVAADSEANLRSILHDDLWPEVRNLPKGTPGRAEMQEARKAIKAARKALRAASRVLPPSAS